MVKKTFFFLLLITFNLSFGQIKDLTEVSIDALMNETQFSSDNPDKMEMIWYVPSTFWQISMLQDPTMTAKDVQDMVELTKGYELVAVVQGDIGNFGGITYKPLEHLKSSIEVNYAGENLSLLDKKDYSSDLSMFLSLMKPMMVNMFGPMGENIHFMVFNSSKKDLLPVDLIGNKDFNISIEGYSVNLDLPLNSLLVEKTCPVDGNAHSGKWNYCPIHGKKLVSK